ncbi:response regulator transcription factor [Brevibacillus reuszeri]|uniref:response regulator transcription factor n=1 Tax=Brevibacillus reuszeri TaxID=54915 RepID=UPI00289E5DA1|nr:response regulator [Brevibacillus reuszeri]
MKKRKLLIVDDEWLIADSLSSLEEWAERNIEVIGTASDGREALAYLDKTEVDLVITDIRMPDMDGLELLRQLHQRSPKIDVIVISGYEEFAYAKTALSYQAKGYILKPIDADELFAVVDQLAPLSLEPVEEAPKTYHETIVERALSYISANLGRPLSLKDAADQVHLTSHYFGQVFKSVIGDTFVNHLTRMRMERACELLKNTELKQYEVGFQIGYTDPKYFSRVFFQSYGLTPKEYRQQLCSPSYPSEQKKRR